MIRIGTAGWSIPKAERSSFPQTGSRLEQYACVFTCVEINSTFYRSHRTTTYERWAASVPEDFRFSLKIPKSITHERRLVECEDLLDSFVRETEALAQKRDVFLVQLPPSLAFDEVLAVRFFETMRRGYAGKIACEPRHRSWFEEPADSVFQDYGIARVAADPASVPDAARPGACSAFAYYRWHGTPRTYYSRYGMERVEMLAASIDRHVPDTWCIFDNTASGAATSDALSLRTFLS